MHRRMKPCRFLTCLLAAGVLAAGSSGAFAQISGVIPGDRAEAALLRARVAELEAQNAAILKQLTEMERRLGQLAANPAVSNTTEVASTVPIVPPLRTAATPPPASPPQAQQLPVQTEGNRSEVGFYGFVRVDAIFDDSRINAFQTPTFVRSEPDESDGRSNFAFHTRLTRFGMNFRAPLPPWPQWETRS